MGMANDGIVRPSYADEICAELGLPNEYHSPLEQFDPHTLSHWTHNMSLSWISWRTDSAVRWYWRDFQNSCYSWDVVYRALNDRQYGVWKFKGYEFTKDPFSDRFNNQFTDYFEELEERNEEYPMLLTADGAKTKLYQLLGEGKLVATRTDNFGYPIDVPANDWAHNQYSDVKLPRAKLLEFFPPRTKKNVGRPKGSGKHDYSEVVKIAIEGIKTKKYKNRHHAGGQLAPDWMEKVGAATQEAFKTGLSKRLKELGVD